MGIDPVPQHGSIQSPLRSKIVILASISASLVGVVYTAILNDGSQHIVERHMDIEGRTFRVCSVFPMTKQSTPTEKLLTLIDNSLEESLKKA